MVTASMGVIDVDRGALGRTVDALADPPVLQRGEIRHGVLTWACGASCEDAHASDKAFRDSHDEFS